MPTLVWSTHALPILGWRNGALTILGWWNHTLPILGWWNDEWNTVAGCTICHFLIIILDKKGGATYNKNNIILRVNMRSFK